MDKKFGVKMEIWSILYFFKVVYFLWSGIVILGIFLFSRETAAVAVEPLVTETKIVEDEPLVTNYRLKPPDDREIRIAWMAPETEYHNFSAATSVGALKLGLSFIENAKSFHGRTVR